MIPRSEWNDRPPPHDAEPEPLWQIIYDKLLANAEFGDIVTYSALTDVIGYRFQTNRHPLYRARYEMGDRRHRWLEAVPGVGYRVIRANEHLRVATGHKRRAQRQLQTMVQVQDVTDLSCLSPAELEEFDAQAHINATLFQIAVHTERRLAKIESILRDHGML